MNREWVVLLHGICRTKRSMRSLENALLLDGYQVLNLDYPSRKISIQEIAALIHPQILAARKDQNEPLHFVSHSMGGLVIRQLLDQYPLPNVGKVVMLGPPNHGSEVADFIQNNILYRLIYGPAGQELTTRRAKSAPFPVINATVGIIAGNSGIDPISHWLLPKGHDGKVSIESTKLTGMADHITLPYSHSFMMYRAQVIKEVKCFLKTGRF